MAKCERYFIFLARVTGTVVLQAAVVFASRDTAYFVLSLFAAESKGDVLSGGDGVSLLSLIVGILAERIEVVAVVNRSNASGKHGAAGAADSYRFRRKNTVGDSDLFGTPADKAAAVVRISSEETSDKGAAFQRDIAAVLALDTDKAAVCAVAFYAAVNRHTAEAVCEITYAACPCHKSCGEPDRRKSPLNGSFQSEHGFRQG